MTLTDALRALGRLSPDEIAALLHDHGVTGDIGSHSACPLAHYLTRVTGEATSVGLSFAFRGEVDVVLPQSTQRFVDRFDTGRYPFLVAVAPSPMGGQKITRADAERISKDGP